MSPVRPTVLLVDDEERILRSLAILFRADYRVLTTTDPQQALEMVARETIHVIVSDQRMPTMRGVDLLREFRQRTPNTVRILLTGYSELAAIVDSVNEGEIFRFINKPWNAAELRQTVAQAAGIARELFEQSPMAAAQPLPASQPPPATSAPAAATALPAAATAAASAATAPIAVAVERIEAGANEHLLVIDDDAEVIRTVREIVGEGFPLHWAKSIDEALVLLERHPIAVVLSELLLKGQPTGGLLKALKAQHAEIVTVVLTPFQDTSVLINLINQGQVYRFLPKPVRRGPLAMNLGNAFRQHQRLKAAPSLRAAHAVQKSADAAELSIASRVLGVLARMRTRISAG